MTLYANTLVIIYDPDTKKLKEIVQDNKTGYLILPNDAEGLERKIEFLLDNKNISIDLGMAGKDRIEKDFSIDKMTSAHMELYKKLLGEVG